MRDFLKDERGAAFEWVLGIATILVCGFFLAVFIEIVTEHLVPIGITLGIPANDPGLRLLRRYWILMPWIIVSGVLFWWFQRGQKQSEVGIRI